MKPIITMDAVIAELDRIERAQPDARAEGWFLSSYYAAALTIGVKNAQERLRALLAQGHVERGSVPMRNLTGRIQRYVAYRLKPKGKP